MDKEELEKILTQAAEGLWMVSETDAPFEFYYAESPVERASAASFMQEENGEVEVEELDYFFRNIIKQDENVAPAMLMEATQFVKMVSTLKKLLQDVKVYRIGKVRVTVYIVGRTDKGDLAGYKTFLVET